MKTLKLIEFIEKAKSLFNTQGMLQVTANTPDFSTFHCHKVQFSADAKEVQFRLNYGLEIYAAELEIECMVSITPVK